MSERFIKALKQEYNYTTTENGAIALKSTNSALLDLFGEIGALRKRTDNEIEAKFIKAFVEDKLLATKMAFYARDIRGGLGERRVFRIILRYLANIHPEIVVKNLSNIPFYGRWDDLYVLVGTPVERDMWNLIRRQLQEDLTNMANRKPVSLMGKWLKSVNTSSPESRRLGKLTAKQLGLTEKQYRKILSKLRGYIDVVEKKMSANEWNKINYSNVPSRAMVIYRNAFYRHDPNRFDEFIENVRQGKEKINSFTLYPYDILERMCDRGFDLVHIKYDPVLEEQWKALPNYIDGEYNVLVMADTSGSMVGRPMATSVGLAIYFAERNKGIWHNKFMTFSSEPSFVEIKGDTLYEKLKCVPEIVENTNLEAALKLILDTAIKHKLTQEDMPKSLIIISDMQFDDATVSYGDMTFYDTMKEMYNRAGYEIPNIVFWQVDSRRDSFQVTSEYKGVQLASGQSPSVFKSILNTIGKTPYEAMLEILNNPRYDYVVV
ncbi:DUF2828 family protein [Paraclostridium dentum]|uniref:DUF2828 family protein n=1 Tax=Paraclostridium dentum TaxID=2662455 RepID=UPI00346478D8